MPRNVALDGELYHPAKSSAHISNIMRGRGRWDGVLIMVFDAPTLKGP